MRLYQLKRLRPYVTRDIACRIYKQTILMLLDDFMIESTSPTYYNRLVKLQEKAVHYIDNNANRHLSYDELYKLYNLQPLKLRWTTATVNQRSNNKFKKTHMRTYEVYLKSPLCRCSKIWDSDRTTKKVKFKNLIKQMC